MSRDDDHAAAPSDSDDAAAPSEHDDAAAPSDSDDAAAPSEHDDAAAPSDSSESVTVATTGHGLRLDVFLSKRFPTWSRNFWHDVIIKGGIRLERPGGDAGRVVAARRLIAGDQIYIDECMLRGVDPHPFDEDITIVHTGKRFIAADKPAGLLTHPAGLFGTGSLIDLVKEHFGMLHLCGRLDRFTSGIVLLARDTAALAAYETAAEKDAIAKEYLALVTGRPPQEEGTVDLPIGKDRESAVRLKMAIVEGGKPSQTVYRLLEHRDGHSLVLVRLVTGRKHQIRLHMAAIGCPIVGDKLYGPVIDYEYFTPGRGNLHSYWPGWHGLHCYRMVLPAEVAGDDGASGLVVTCLPAGAMASELAQLGFDLSALD